MLKQVIASRRVLSYLYYRKLAEMTERAIFLILAIETSGSITFAWTIEYSLNDIYDELIASLIVALNLIFR